MANLLTGCRILCAVLLLAFPPLSPAFCALYLTGGLTDMLDGWIARRTHTESELGERLDTAADFVLLAACLARLLPAVCMPRWLPGAIAGIAGIKAVNVLSGFVCRGRFVAAHTALNRLAGMLLFLLPLTLPFVPLAHTAPPVCAVAALAAVHEGHVILTGQTGGTRG